MEDDLLRAETIVLANLCVCYVVTKQNQKAEDLIAKIETHEIISFKQTGK